VALPSSTHSRNLGDLARVRPADRTLQNLLGTLSAKLELASRIPIFEYEAGVEGHEDVANVFAELGTIEHESFNQLLVCLRRYLEQTVPREPEKRTKGQRR
jgi:hypothetical protein